MELLLPVTCAGCGAPGAVLCVTCRGIWRATPQRVSVDVDFPVWSLSAYDGPHRKVMIAMKERGRRDVAADVGAVIRASISFLVARGDIEPTVHLVPAPTRARSRRARGGDPVERVCVATGLPTSTCLRIDSSSPDSVGLGREERRRSLRVELIRVPPSPVLLIDDVVTTGATLSASVNSLRTAGVQVRGALTFCHA